MLNEQELVPGFRDLAYCEDDDHRRTCLILGKAIYFGKKGEEELFQACREEADRHGYTLLESTTPRELLSSIFYVSPEEVSTMDEEDREDSEWILSLAKEYGWDTQLYRCDYIAYGAYSQEEITHMQAIRARLEYCGYKLRGIREA